MGVRGLLTLCKDSLEEINEVDILVEGRSADEGIELVIDLMNFLHSLLEVTISYVERQHRDFGSVGHLGGEYAALDLLATRFITRLQKNKVYPVFFNDGSIGCDKTQFYAKKETLAHRQANIIANTAIQKQHCENLSNVGVVSLGKLSVEQIKITIERTGAKFVQCTTEADTDIARYLADNPRAFAVLGIDSDFCVMKDCRLLMCDDFFENLVLTETLESLYVRVWTVQDTIRTLKLESHKQLMDVAILLGNDFSGSFHQDIWHKQHFPLDVIRDYLQDFDSTIPLHKNPNLQELLEKKPEFEETVELCYRFYNLEKIHKEEPNTSSNPLYEHIVQQVVNGNIGDIALAYYNGIRFEWFLMEDYLRYPSASINLWCRPLCNYMCAMCTNETELLVVGRTRQSLNEEFKVPVPDSDWLPQVHEVSALDLQQRWLLFEKLVCMDEEALVGASIQAVYNTPACHEFFKGFGLEAGYVMYSVNLLLNLTYVNNFSVELWEIAAILATALGGVLHATNKENGRKYLPHQPQWKKPTMRCITLSTWFLCISKNLYQLSRFLQLPGFPAPANLYSGVYFSSLYMHLRRGSGNSDLMKDKFIPAEVRRALYDLVSDNKLLEDRHRASMLQHLQSAGVTTDQIQLRPDELTGSSSSRTTLLPIEDHRADILDHVNKFRVTCIQGETGSGKSTKVPQYIYHNYENKRRTDQSLPATRIIVAQPRQLAAISLAQRVSAEMGRLVETVTFKVNNDYNIEDRMKIIYVTSGYLIRYLTRFPAHFATFSHVILDEIHERTVDNDLLSLIVKLLMRRHDGHPKVVLMTATLEKNRFLEYFSEHEETLGSLEQHHLSVGVRSPYSVREVYLEDLPQYFQNRLKKGTLVEVLRLYCHYNQISMSDLILTHELDSESDQETEEGQSKKQMSELCTKLHCSRHITFRDLSCKRGGRVTIMSYSSLLVDLLEASCAPEESILVFLPGQNEIDEIYDKLKEKENHIASSWVCPIRTLTLHGKLSFEDQKECFKVPPSNMCHIILATNIAESSLTIPHVTLVLDMGQRRTMVYDSRRRVQTLRLTNCSKDSLAQRKGRTGRVCNGVVIRMMTRQDYSDREEFDQPELQLAALEKSVLLVKHVGGAIAPELSPSELLSKAIQPPDVANINVAVTNLAELGFIASKNELAPTTLLGKLANRLPLDLQYVRLIFFGILFNCPTDAIVMTACLQVQDPFKRPCKKAMKQFAFVNSQRLSSEQRRHWDNASYCEPMMLRNLYREWLILLSSNKDLNRASLKRRFCSDCDLIESRFNTLDGFLRELCDATLLCVPRGSNTFSQILALRDCIAGRSPFPGPNDGEFSHDLLINTVLAAAMCPKFIVGRVQYKHNRRKGTVAPIQIEKKMKAVNIKPERSLYFPRIPSWLLEEDGMKQLIKILDIISLNKQHIPRYRNRFNVPDNNVAFQILPLSRTKAFVEYQASPSKREPLAPSDVTVDVHHVLHNVNQYTEVLFTNELSVELEGPTVLEKNNNEKTVKLAIPTNPCQLEWELLSADGAPLRKNHFTCRVRCDWRNPLGFVCDIQKRQHFGVTSKFTPQGRATHGFVDGTTMFPVYKDNLFAILILLMFIPHDMSVSFKARLHTKRLEYIRLFECDIALPKINPIEPKHMALVNAIRGEISRVLRSGEGMNNASIPFNSVRQLYDKFMHCVHTSQPVREAPSSTETVPQCDSDSDTESDSNKRDPKRALLCIDAFSAQSVEQGPNNDRTSQYLIPYDHRLFSNEQLGNLIDSKAKSAVLVEDSESESESESDVDFEKDDYEDINLRPQGILVHFLESLLDVLRAQITARLKTSVLPLQISELEDSGIVRSVLMKFNRYASEWLSLKDFLRKCHMAYCLIPYDERGYLVCLVKSEMGCLFEELKQALSKEACSVLSKVLYSLLQRKPDHTAKLRMLSRLVKTQGGGGGLKAMLEEKDEIFHVSTSGDDEYVSIYGEKINFVTSTGQSNTPGATASLKRRLFKYIYSKFECLEQRISLTKLNADEHVQSMLEEAQNGGGGNCVTLSQFLSTQPLLAIVDETHVCLARKPHNAIYIDLVQLFKAEQTRNILLGKYLVCGQFVRIVTANDPQAVALRQTKLALTKILKTSGCFALRQLKNNVQIIKLDSGSQVEATTTEVGSTASCNSITTTEVDSTPSCNSTILDSSVIDAAEPSDNTNVICLSEHRTDDEYLLLYLCKILNTSYRCSMNTRQLHRYPGVIELLGENVKFSKFLTQHKVFCVEGDGEDMYASVACTTPHRRLPTPPCVRDLVRVVRNTLAKSKTRCLPVSKLLCKKTRNLWAIVHEHRHGFPNFQLALNLADDVYLCPIQTKLHAVIQKLDDITTGIPTKHDDITTIETGNSIKTTTNCRSDRTAFKGNKHANHPRLRNQQACRELTKLFQEDEFCLEDSLNDSYYRSGLGLFLDRRIMGRKKFARIRSSLIKPTTNDRGHRTQTFTLGTVACWKVARQRKK